MTDGLEPILDWRRNDWWENLCSQVYSAGHANIPVTGYMEIHEPEIGQRQAVMWETVKADGSRAETPADAKRLLMGRPAQKGGTDTDWKLKVEKMKVEFIRSKGYIRDNYDREQQEKTA